MELSLRQQYLNYYVVAQNLILKISNQPELLVDQNVQEKMIQLRECLTLPVTKESIQFLKRKIDNLEKYINTLKPVENHTAEEEGRQSGYTKVKKSGNVFIPVEEDSEKKDIEVPNYDVPIQLPKRSSLRETPDYIFHDKPVRISPITNYNRGSSHVFMLAFLTFLFESIFLVLAFLLYQ